MGEFVRLELHVRPVGSDLRGNKSLAATKSRVIAQAACAAAGAVVKAAKFVKKVGKGVKQGVNDI